MLLNVTGLCLKKTTHKKYRINQNFQFFDLDLLIGEANEM